MYRINYAKTGKIILINITITIVLVLLLELPARLFEKSDKVMLFSDRTDFIRGRPFVAEDDEVGFLLVPNYRSSDVNINSSGFRGSDFEDDTNDGYLILAIGGSTTFGWALDDQDTYPQQLERILRSNKLLKESGLNISVINAGIPSFTSTQQKLYLHKILEEMRPDLVLVMTGINDYYYSMLANWYPEVLLLRTPPYWMSFLRENSALFRLLLKNKIPKEFLNVFNEDTLELFRSNIKEMIEIAVTNKIDIVAIAPPFNINAYLEKGFSPFNEIIHKGAYITSSQSRFWDAQVDLFTKSKKISIDHSMSVTKITDKKYFLDHCHLTPEGNQILVGEVAHQLVKILLKRSPEMAKQEIREILFFEPLPHEVKVSGLSHLEDWGRWSNARTVTIDFQKVLPRNFTLVLEAYSFSQLKAPFGITIGGSTQEFILQDNEMTHTTLTFNDIQNDRYTITIAIPNPTSPNSLNQSADIRELGIRIRSILIEPSL